MNKIGEFIEANKLDVFDLDSDGSASNSLACILSGYALYLGLSFDDLTNTLIGYNEDVISFDLSELERVFDYAKDRNYGGWWSFPVAHDMYKF